MDVMIEERAIIVEKTGKIVGVQRINRAESPLGWLRVRGLVTDRQFAAGEALRRDYETAGLGARVTMDWDASPLDGQRRGSFEPRDTTTRIVSAKMRFDKAMATAGPGLSDILWRVICACDTVPIAERKLGWPGRSGRLVLTLALDRVADAYRVA
jgi:Domain of unknown function (DUF6456)